MEFVEFHNSDHFWECWVGKRHILCFHIRSFSDKDNAKFHLKGLGFVLDSSLICHLFIFICRIAGFNRFMIRLYDVLN